MLDGTQRFVADSWVEFQDFDLESAKESRRCAPALVMTTFAKALRVLPALGLLGCVSDFSPDPYKGDQNVSPDLGRDAGPGAGDESERSRPDAKLPRRDVREPDTTDQEDPAEEPSAPTESGKTTASDACDLSGRWIVTERATSVAAGAKQINLTWFYVELTQRGDAFTMSKTLLCGGSTKSPPGELVSIVMDDSPAWPAYQKYTNYDGRKGTSVKSGAGCDLTVESAALVRGATVSAYKDPSAALPTAEQKASGSSPGWEDWDEDGKPGVTMNVPTVNAKLYTAFRTVTNYKGSIAANSSRFQLDTFEWEQKRVVYGSSADPITAQLINTAASRSPAAGHNFVEFARLAPDQATGSDDEICDAIRELVPTLNAAANPSQK